MYHIFYKLKFFFQRVFRGWDDREVYNMDYELIKWFIPRLKRFKEITTTYPAGYNSITDWKNEIQSIIDIMEDVYNRYWDLHDLEQKDKIFDWIRKNITNLWF